uniref:HAD-IC family P-type ATPase n=1 Tax=Clostridium sp. TaxID=1506 RepID=UPI002633EB8D
SMGIKKIVMLTGDNKDIASSIGKVLGVDEVYSELLPQDKVEKLEKLQKEKSTKGKIVFVGDGINDAPVLARADIGIAMGGVGSDAAIEAADIVIMTDEPSKIALGIQIAQKTKKIVMQNIVFALGVKAIILIFAVFGVANMWEAVFGDVGVALIAVLNSMRAMKV